MKKMTEIEEVKAQIKLLEKKVALLEEIERIEKKKETQNLTDLIYDWWDDVFTTNSDWDMETSIDDLVTRIEEWLPKEQSAAGSQNVYVECTVEGFNDCLKKIKGKLR
jgi:DNA phosphorothioation-dependent restriction protein DptG